MVSHLFLAATSIAPLQSIALYCFGSSADGGSFQTCFSNR